MSTCTNTSKGAKGAVLDPASWASFLPDIIPFVSSPKEDYRRPPDNLIVHFARLAAQEFLQDSTLLRDKFCFDLQCGVDTLPLPVPPERELLHVHSLSVSTEAVSLCGNRCLEWDDGCGGCPMPETARVVGFEYDSFAGELRLPFAPTGDARNGFCASYSYTMDLGRCDVPELLQGQQWRRAVRAYTLKHLYAMDDMDWGDKAYFGKYEQEAAHWAAKGRMQAANNGVTRRKRLSPKTRNLFWS